MESDALERHLDTAISKISRILFPNPILLFSTSQRRLNALGGMAFYVQNRICQVSNRIWHVNFPRYLHGCYENGKIFLKEGNWCRKTLYHEALHGTSILMIPDVYQSIGRKHIFLREGLTEFLTGYILSREHKQCYNAWRNGTFDECRISYKGAVKLWGAFCRFFRLEEVIRLYFWDGAMSWGQKYTAFLNAIHQAGYQNFRDVLALEGDTQILFTQECIDNFGREFQDILNSRRSLELDNIRT